MPDQEDLGQHRIPSTGRFIECVACGRPVPLRRNVPRVECDCGKEYSRMTGQPIEEPICGRLFDPPS
jgi:hypothetical protein